MDASPDRRRLVLVTEVDESVGVATAMLATNEVELSGGGDIAVGPEETGLPYLIAVETDVTGLVWFAQLGQPVGKVSRTLPFREELFTGQVEDLPIRRRGLPIINRRDSRWDWKQREAAELRQLTADCGSALVEGRGTVIVLDDGLTASDREDWKTIRELIFATSLLNEGNVLVEAGALAAIEDVQTFEVPAGLGLDVVTALAFAVQRHAPARIGPKHGVQREVQWHPRRRGNLVATSALEERLCRLADEGHRSIVLATSDRLWQDAAVVDRACMAIDSERGRLQILARVAVDDDEPL
jgi:hypothetical protein